jgi:hypothetical protein
VPTAIDAEAYAAADHNANTRISVAVSIGGIWVIVAIRSRIGIAVIVGVIVIGVVIAGAVIPGRVSKTQPKTTISPAAIAIPVSTAKTAVPVTAAVSASVSAMKAASRVSSADASGVTATSARVPAASAMNRSLGLHAQAGSQ